MLTLILVVVFLACGIAWWFRNANKDEPPAYPGYLPLIGHAHLFLGDTTILWNHIKAVSYQSLKNDGAVSVSLGPIRLYIVSDPTEFLKIANACLDKDPIYKFANPWIGNGLVTSDAPVWKTHRKMLNPAFNPAILDGFLDMFNSQARRMVKFLEVEIDKGPFDHFDYCRNNALETICFGALGLDFRDKIELYNQYFNATDEIFNILIQRIQKIWLHNDFLFGRSELKRRQDEILAIIHNMSAFVLKQKKADLLNCNNEENAKKGKGTVFKPFLDLILEQATEKGSFNDQEIREHVDTIIVGGYDTSAIALTFAMTLIGSYPRVQKKIYEELYKVFGDDDRDVMKQDLSKLVYLEAVLKETLRFYPVAPVIARHLDRDIKLRNCTLFKGRTCFLSIYGVHRHPMWGPDVEEFKPERWLDPATLPDIPNPFAAFSLGRRNCIGQAYAIMSIKVNLVHIFRQYKVYGDHTKMVARMDILLKPASGHNITIEKRNK